MPDPAASTETSGFTEEERNELKALIAEAVGSATPPATPPAPAGPPAVTDDEWDKMSDRQRESWVRSLVDGKLDELVKLDADRRRDAEIEALKNRKPEEEGPPADKPPGILAAVQKFLWGSDPDKP